MDLQFATRHELFFILRDQEHAARRRQAETTPGIRDTHVSGRVIRGSHKLQKPHWWRYIFLPGCACLHNWVSKSYIQKALLKLNLLVLAITFPTPFGSRCSWRHRGKTSATMSLSKIMKMSSHSRRNAGTSTFVMFGGRTELRRNASPFVIVPHHRCWQIFNQAFARQSLPTFQGCCPRPRPR
jgi:hypothetical protein